MLQHEPENSQPIRAMQITTWETRKAEAQLAQERAQKEAVDTLLAQVKRKDGKQGFLHGIIGGVTILFSATISLIICVLIAKGLLALHWHIGDWFFILGSTTGIAVGAGVVGAIVTQKRKHAFVELAKFDDIRAVGPFIEALRWRERSERAVAETALIRLLPRLQASDTSLLSATQREILIRELWQAGSPRRKNSDLALAILKAYEQVGDETALPAVQYLAALGGRDTRLQNAALECLKFLPELVEKQRAAQTLLRASSADNAVPADVLLRPASGVTTTDPQQLLRSSLHPSPPAPLPQGERGD